jgi:hypothetical protein
MISIVIARLLATLGPEAVGALRTVAGAAEYAALQAPPLAARQPAAYVLPLSEEGGPNGLAAGPVRQRITATFGVVLMATSLRDARGEAAADLLGPLCDAIRSQLVGFQPTPAHDPIEFRRGRLLDITEGTLAWQDEFTTSITVRFG